MEPTIKPGTRCECRGTTGHSHSVTDTTAARDDFRCPADAVRMVTVRVQEFAPNLHTHITRKRNVPMCPACATWYEKKGV